MKNSSRLIQESMKGALTVFIVLSAFFGSRAYAEGEEGTSSAPAAATSETTADMEGAPAGDMPATGSEPIPVETGVPVPKNARERFRRSRLTKDTSEGAADRRRVLLTAGEDKVVDLDFDVEAGPSGIITGNSTIAMTTLVRIGDQRRQIVFKPLKAGETTVTVRDPEGGIKVIFDVIVTQSNLLRRAGEIRDLLKDIEGIDVKVVGPNVIVDGEILVPSDYARMVSVISTKPYSDIVMPLANLSALALQSLSRRIQEDINTFAPNVKTRVVNGMVFLEGTVDDINQARRADALAQLYLPEARPGNALANKDPGAAVIVNRKMVQNFLVVNPPPPKKQDKLVKMTIHFVELSKNYNKTFGFNWAPGFTSDPSISFGQQANGTVGTSSTSFTATLSSLFPKLQSAQDAGFARILKQGSVIVKNDIQGQLAENRDIPIVTTDQNGRQIVNFTSVGLNIKVKPTILGQSEDLQVFIDISQKNVIGESNGQPLISNRAMNTTLYLKSQESAAIGGFEGTDMSTSFNKPTSSGSFEGGTTTPIFNLNRSKAYTKSKGQFVVFVTPQLIESASEASEDLKKNFRVKVK